MYIQVKMHYATVHFKLVILDGQDGYIGKHNTLQMIEHASNAEFEGVYVYIYVFIYIQ
jgi:hypothetical protein